MKPYTKSPWLPRTQCGGLVVAAAPGTATQQEDDIQYRNIFPILCVKLYAYVYTCVCICVYLEINWMSLNIFLWVIKFQFYFNSA